jgi:hypothetical protein
VHYFCHSCSLAQPRWRLLVKIIELHAHSHVPSLRLLLRFKAAPSRVVMILFVVVDKEDIENPHVKWTFARNSHCLGPRISPGHHSIGGFALSWSTRPAAPHPAASELIFRARRCSQSSVRVQIACLGTTVFSRTNPSYRAFGQPVRLVYIVIVPNKKKIFK